MIKFGLIILTILCVIFTFDFCTSLVDNFVLSFRFNKNDEREIKLQILKVKVTNEFYRSTYLNNFIKN